MMMQFLFSLFVVVISLVGIGNVYGEDFYKDVNITWGNDQAKILDNGTLLTLSLVNATGGSGFSSIDEYLFGRIDMQIKLVTGNSAGTVTTFYLASRDPPIRDEIDFEFLGNLSGEPYTVHTNIYTKGQGNREQQFFLWFDPTLVFHTYSILWNPKNIIFYIDDIPIRVFQNGESRGIVFPLDQPMRLSSSLWNGDDWATQQGRVKIDWRFSPFIASFTNFKTNACIWSDGISSCTQKPLMPWFSYELEASSQATLERVQKKYMVYNYCLDTQRFPQGLPPECTIP